MKNSKLNILTFNWHEAYICMLAKTGHKFDIVERLKGGSKEWFYQTRPVPANGGIISIKTSIARLKSGMYDCVICHNFMDLLDIISYDLPKILVFHNKLSTELALGGGGITKKQYLEKVFIEIDKAKNLHFIFISQSKKDDWELDGNVITPGVDTKEYYGYIGNEKKVLRIGNFMKKRDIMLGYYHQEKILKGIPNLMLGLNEKSENSRFTKTWDDLKKQLKTHRVFLNTTVEGYEDGYNLACLEAMATGAPVVSTYNSTSPIVDGVNGYISRDLTYLTERIKYLFENTDKAIELGEEGRKTVEDKFNILDFINKWNSLFDQIIEVKAKDSDRFRIPKKDKKNILLAYAAYPATTGRFFEESLRRNHNVTTCGPALDEKMIKGWALQNMKEKVEHHEISCAPDIDIGKIIKNLHVKDYPDLFLWIESVYGYFPKGIEKLHIPTCCYLIDSHMHIGWQLEWAKNFDMVFIAQREYIPKFLEAGCKNVKWLPLAFDQYIHKKYPVKKEHDVCFVGSLTKDHVRRNRLLNRLSEKFNVHKERSFLKDMAATFSKSKIIFNESIKEDLNMRVFEAMGTGSLLFTDEATGSGLTDLFADRKHLVIYNENNLLELTEYYLAHEEERERIALCGRNEVLKKHTYDHRTQVIIDEIFHFSRSLKGNEISYDNNLLDKELFSKSHTDKEKLFFEYCEILNNNIDNEKILTNLILIANIIKKNEIAERYIRDFLELHPLHIKILLLFGKILIEEKKLEESKEVLEKLLLFDSENKEVMELVNHENFK